MWTAAAVMLRVALLRPGCPCCVVGGPLMVWGPCGILGSPALLWLALLCVGKPCEVVGGPVQHVRRPVG